jgi:hypothetical protein
MPSLADTLIARHEGHDMGGMASAMNSTMNSTMGAMNSTAKAGGHSMGGSCKSEYGGRSEPVRVRAPE